jgi:hypothetical protein
MNYYETFIGSLTPAEFVAPFLGAEDPVDAAIGDMMNEWPWECSIPEDFVRVVRAYIEDSIDFEAA